MENWQIVFTDMKIGDSDFGAQGTEGLLGPFSEIVCMQDKELDFRCAF